MAEQWGKGVLCDGKSRPQGGFCAVIAVKTDWQ